MKNKHVLKEKERREKLLKNKPNKTWILTTKLVLLKKMQEDKLILQERKLYNV